MRYKLIELMAKRFKELHNDGDWNFNEMLANVADYLIKKGVIVPPCKVGDVVYKLMDVETAHRQILELRVLRISIEETGIMFACQTVKKYRYNFDTLNIDDFGKTVFLTKEEAEKALKARANNE